MTMMIMTRRFSRRGSVLSGSRRLLSMPPYGASPAPSDSESKYQWVGACADLATPRSISSFSASRFSKELRYMSMMSHTLSRHYSSTHAAAVDRPFDGIVDIPLAQTGEGIAECELLKWFVEEGDDVEEFQPLCEVQSDKATIEITSRYKGKISQVLHVPGDIVKVGETLLRINVEEFQDQTLASDGLVKDDPSSLYSVGETSVEGVLVKEDRQGGALCAPAVRAFARQYGINVNDVQGSGDGGRVLKEDILRLVNGKDKDSTTPILISEQQSSGRDIRDLHLSTAEKLHIGDTNVALRGYQRAMFKSMTMVAKIPHFHYVEEIICDSLLRLKASFQKENSDPTLKHTFLPALVKSLSMALNKYPMMNSTCGEQMAEVVLKGSHNIGIAMATPHGLVVPNIKNVQSLSILEITKELSRLHQQAMENKLGPDDVSGGTITLSNIGAIGGQFGSPLVNTPEVAIIAIGRILKVPRFAEDGSLYPVSCMNVNIGADHRVLDGAAVARFCNEWKAFVERPELLLLHTR